MNGEIALSDVTRVLEESNKMIAMLSSVIAQKDETIKLKDQDIEEKREVIVLQGRELEETRPKAESYDQYISTDGYLSMKDVSDVLSLKIKYKDGVKIASRNQILEALVASGNIQKSFNGYKCLQVGRDHGLLVRSKIANGKEYTVVLAERKALDYIYKLMKKAYEVVA